MSCKMKRFTAAALTVCLLFALTGCGASNQAEEGKTKVRVAYFPNITHAQALVMKNKGTLEEKWKDKCEVNWVSFNAGPAEMEAIFAGEIDLGYIGPVPALSANVKSSGNVKIISNATNAGAVLLKRKDAGISSVKDLAGKKIAVPQMGNTQHLCLLALLSENGLKTTDKGGDVTINVSSNADILNLIGNASVDAAFVPEPWGTIIESKGNAEVLLDYDEVFLNGNYPAAVVVADSDFLHAHPDLVKDFLEAHKAASLFINENPEESREIVNAEIEGTTGKAIDTDVLRSAFARMKADTALNQDAIMKFAQMSKEEGFINTVPEVGNVFTTEFHP